MLPSSLKYLGVSFAILSGSICIASSPSISQAPGQAIARAPLFEHLGNFHHPISTQIPLAQRFFDQGLVFFYGFEWGESVRSFQEAVRLDPSCAICYWGLALATGSKGNTPLDGHEYSRAQEAIRNAIRYSGSASAIEKALIQALSLRLRHEQIHGTENKAFTCHSTGTQSDTSKQDLLEYAEEMGKLVERFPKDNDAKALFAYSWFDVVGWVFWDNQGKINSHTPRVVAALEAILSQDETHPGGNHYYVHLMEQSPDPKKGLESAERLRTLVPDSEHLIHMPAHIYFNLGRYHDATDANLKAIATFKNYEAVCRKQKLDPEINFLFHHNLDYLRSSATVEGRKALALSAAQELVENSYPSRLESEPTLRGFLAIPYFVKARFGMWEDLLKETRPNPKYKYPLGMWHYVRGLALNQLNPRETLKKTISKTSAKKEAQELFRIIEGKTTEKDIPETQLKLLKIAHAVLKANIAAVENNEESTLAELGKAADIQFEMGYHEPPDWYFQIQESLGDAYLKWGHFEKSAAMYRAALKKMPGNGWVLAGLARALRKLNQIDEALLVELEFKEAWKNSDIPAPMPLFH